MNEFNYFTVIHSIIKKHFMISSSLKAFIRVKLVCVNGKIVPC